MDKEVILVRKVHLWNTYDLMIKSLTLKQVFLNTKRIIPNHLII